MAIKKLRTYVGVPFVNLSGLDCSTQAVSGTIAHLLHGSQTGIAIVPERPHSQEQASDA